MRSRGGTFIAGRRADRTSRRGRGRDRIEWSLDCSADTGPNLHLYDTAMAVPELNQWIQQRRKGGR
ncbi:hypothetical protein [Bifidobacterium catulorum]|uniref:Uncharacterized protein n=1 Tax=Bifidobacterium catulorum TaxID=1630173 RepID=A0A2U2MUE1_9BIFI|nr:hypothetical protein [Bifidobacterium catulorum]PWG60480.1 hypothetical protein DF200_02470 [Bifidobacterium catulorum]